jgi:hypothetical protein
MNQYEKVLAASKKESRTGSSAPTSTGERAKTD